MVAIFVYLVKEEIPILRFVSSLHTLQLLTLLFMLYMNVSDVVSAYVAAK